MSFNLDISSYNIRELEDLFSISAPYSPLVVKQKAEMLTENIQNDKTVVPELKEKTIQFINQGVEVLLSNAPRTSPLPITDILPQTPYAPIQTTAGDHDIQIIPGQPIKYTMSYPQEFFPGTLNPLQKRVIKQSLNIDTRFRDNYSITNSTNCAIFLPIHLNPVLNMHLTSIEIPNSFYVITKQYGNNYFSISAGNERIIYTVPDGNYNSSDLIDYLNNYAANNGYTPSGNPLLYYISFGLNVNGTSGTGQVIIGVSPSYPGSEPFIFTVNFNINPDGYLDEGTPLQMKFGWLLGYRAGIYDNGYAYVSEGMIDLYGPRYCFLAIDDYNNNVNNGFHSAYNSSSLNRNILARLSIPNATNNAFNIYSWNNMNLLSYPRQYFGPVNIGRLGIQLLDEYGRTLYLNNMDFSFCLTFEVAYDL